MLVTQMLIKNVKIPKKDEEIISEFYHEPQKKLIPKMKEIYKRWIPEILNKYPCLQILLDKLNIFKENFDEKIFIKSSEL